MNWKAGLFRIWLVASACWIAFVAWITYLDVVVPRLQTSACRETRQALCTASRKAHPDLGNYFDCFDEPPPPQNLFEDLIPHHGWFGDLLPSCKLFDDIPLDRTLLLPEIVKQVAVAAAPPLAVMLLWWIGIWIAAGFRRTTG
jgi:hypothetical protein